jgi:hypothetical protein
MPTLCARPADLETQVEDLRTQLDEAAAAAPAAAAAAPAAPAGTKHVEVQVRCNIPCDVSIMDDSTRFWISEEITGQQTFEGDIRQNSGLLAEASNLDQSGQLYVGVYENGELVAEDSDAQYAQIIY